MELELSEIIVRLVLGLVIGFCIGLSGVGGGVMVIPSLTLIVGLPATLAVGTASFYAFLTKIYATYRHYRLGNIDWKTSTYFLVGAVPANILTSWLINRHIANLSSQPDSLASFQNGLETFIAIVILFSALVLIFNTFVKKKKPKAQAPGEESPAESEKRPNTEHRPVASGLAGAVVGALIGATAVGGGVLILPILIVIFGMPPARTVGSSIFIAVVLTLFTSLVYFTGKQLDTPTAVVMALGSLGGVEIGSRLSVKIPEKKLKGIVIAIILISAVLMLFK